MKSHFDRVEWTHYELDTGKKIKGGIQYLNVPSNRLQGPGVNNSLISRLKKGEDVILEMPELNLRAEFFPRKSAW